jgi:hypothetical protein
MSSRARAARSWVAVIIENGPDRKILNEVLRVSIESPHIIRGIPWWRVTFTREHTIALDPRGKRMVGITIGYLYEVRDEKDYFDEHPVPKTHEGHAGACRLHLGVTADFA